MSETELEMILRHMREGEAIVSRQTALVAGLAQNSEPYELSMVVLHQFKVTLGHHQDHLAR